jgi:soluble lytic murein transglycosylase-like protein
MARLAETPLGFQADRALEAATDGAAKGAAATASVSPLQGQPTATRAATAGAAPGVAGGSAFDGLLRAAAAREGVDPHLVAAVATAESRLNPLAVSPAGAKGLMQLMDGTARSLGVADSLDPAQNAAGGARYLRQLLDRFDGDVPHALAAYNAGPGAVDRYGGIPPFKETQEYVQRVLGYRDHYQASAQQAATSRPQTGTPELGRS